MSETNFNVLDSLTVNSTFLANSTQVSFSTINATSNGFLANTTVITFGNSSVNVNINTTSFSGTANNALSLNGVSPSAYINTTGNYTLSGNIVFAANVKINTGASLLDSTGSQGSIGQVLTSNGTGNVYWASVSSLPSVNQALQYTWTNTQSFANTITFGSTVLSTNAIQIVSNTATALYIVSNTGILLQLANATSNLAGLYANGNFGIGNSVPTDRLSINGSTYHGGNVRIAPGVAIIDSTGSQGQPTYVLTSNGSGNVYWAAVSASTGAAGSNTQIQYDNSGTLAGAVGLTWNNVSNTLTVSNNLVVSGNANINSFSMTIADGTGNTVVVNSSAITLSSNLLSLGSYSNSAGANGYTYLPNGVKMIYGIVAANASQGTITFPSAFASNVVSLQLTSYNNQTPYYTSLNSTAAVVRSASTSAASNVCYLAIGF